MHPKAQYRKCGRPDCPTCRNGRGHGPYLYRKERGRWIYIGKEITYTLDTTRLKAARLARRWTMKYIARKIGVPQSSYAGWEEGRHIPRDYARRKLVALFGLSQEELGFTERRKGKAST